MKLNRSRVYYIKDISFHYPFSDQEISIKGEISINEKDVVLISGNSGSGKSTLLYMLKGLIPHVINGKAQGRVELYGENILESRPKSLAKVGYIFQNPNSAILNPTVIDEIAFGLENKELMTKEIAEEIKNYTRKFGIEELLSRQTASLSGGEKQKIALIATIITSPDILIFDEPTAFLDPESAEIFIKTFRQICKNKTIIIVEHNTAYLEGYVNRHFWLDSHGVLREVFASNLAKKIPITKSEQPILGDSLLNISKLSFSYQQDVILKDLSLNLRFGEIVGIVGKNGAGKSTLLKIICKQLKKYHGKVEILGQELKKYSKKELYRRVTLLFQNPETHFIFDSLAKEVSHDLELLKQFNLPERQNQNPFTLSEGEKRRLSLAIVWSLSRSLILLDEPTFGQDSSNLVSLINLLKKIDLKDRGIIIVAHDFYFLKNVCHRILRLENGQLKEELS